MFTFGRNKRLLTAKQFQRVFKSPQKFTQRGLTVYIRRNDIAHARVGLIIAKKKVAKAYARNRIKRLIRESFRRQPQLDSWDIIIMVGKGSDKKSNYQLRMDLDELWLQLISRSEKSS